MGAPHDASVAEDLARPTLDAEPPRSSASSSAADEPAGGRRPGSASSDLGPLYYQHVYGVPAETRASRARSTRPSLDGAVTCGEYHWAGLGTRRSSSSEARSSARSTGSTAASPLRGGRHARLRADGRRQAAAARAAAAAAVGLGADGAIVTTDAGGNSHTDVMLTVRACEQAGVRTTAIVAEMADPDSTSSGLTDWVPRPTRSCRPGTPRSSCRLGARARPRRRHPARRHAGGDRGPIPVRNYLAATNQTGQHALTATTW